MNCCGHDRVNVIVRNILPPDIAAGHSVHIDNQVEMLAECDKIGERKKLLCCL